MKYSLCVRKLGKIQVISPLPQVQVVTLPLSRLLTLLHTSAKRRLPCQTVSRLMFTPLTGEALLFELLNDWCSSLTGLSGDRFRFDNNGDGPARYNIIHFKQFSSGRYGWVTVGQYVDGELRLNMTGEFLVD